ncbi:hypothetical protein ACFWU3_06795 [Streptomyces sp. NPDC058685]|uniref:hypothetical protein n=1 Tax=Streptomyces sp. NPDC058685 TaxID=3346598 RepID=UPI00364FDC34
MVIAGMLLPQGLLLASGLVTAGVATHLLAVPDTAGRPLHAPARRSLADPDDREA